MIFDMIFDGKQYAYKFQYAYSAIESNWIPLYLLFEQTKDNRQHTCKEYSVVACQFECAFSGLFSVLALHTIKQV